MNNKGEKQQDQALDRLLSGILKDDLPPEVDSRMQGQIHQFQDRLVIKQSQVWHQRILPKAVLASGALLLVVVGGFLQAKGPQSLLTENISLVGISLNVSNKVGSSTSMLSSVVLKRENEQTREYVVRWLSSGLTRVDVLTAEHETSKTIWIKKTGITVADYTRETVHEFDHMEQIADPFIQPLLVLLSPENLTEVLYGEWQLRSRQQKGDCEWKTYAITPLQQKKSMQLTVDSCTYLPVKVEKTIAFPLESTLGEKAQLTITFQWNAPIKPQLMHPKTEKMKKNV